MLNARSVAGALIRLPAEQWAHMIHGFPEMRGQEQRVIDTLAAPQLIQRGDQGELLAARFYQRTPLTSKFLVVVYRETSPHDGFVITAYFTRRPSARRETLWQQ